MIAFPPCKINLGLWITERRADGYHNLQTVFFPVPWNDMLEIIPHTETVLTVTGISVTVAMEENLCYKAWKLMADKYAVGAVKMHLHKIIPSGAGLGGGSADAAHTLLLLNQLFSLNLSVETLQELAAQLGMDCPFFVTGTPAFATGRGEILQPISINLNNYYLLIVKPDIHVSTALAYSLIKPKPRQTQLSNGVRQPVKEWKTVLENDFETPLFERFPQLKAIRDAMYENGAVYAAMSGSGSAIFGLYEQEPALLPEWKKHQAFSAYLGATFNK